MQKSRLAVLGIDGMDWNLTLKFIDKLPNILSLSKKGTLSKLESIEPTLSCPSWPCMFTGLSPKDLDMYDFLDLETGRLFNSRDWWQKSLFYYLDSKGITQALWNIPFSFPPHKLAHGIIVPGFLGSPSTKFFIDISSKNKEVVNLREVTKLFKEESFSFHPEGRDLFVSCLYSLDPLQHYFWKYMDTNSKWKSCIEDFYIEVDKYIGWASKVSENLIVVSDHGFGSYTGGFNINRWLESKNLLRFRKETGNSLRKISSLLKRVPYAEKLAFLAPEKLKTRGELRDMVVGLKRALAPGTWAYSPSVSSGCIFTLTKSIALEIRKSLEEEGFTVYLNTENPYLIVRPTCGIYPMNSWDKKIRVSSNWSGSHTLSGIFISSLDLKCPSILDVRGLIESILK